MSSCNELFFGHGRTVRYERISPRTYALPWNASHSEPEFLRTPAGDRAAIALSRSNTTVKRVGASQIVSVRARAVTAMDAARLTERDRGGIR